MQTWTQRDFCSVKRVVRVQPIPTGPAHWGGLVEAMGQVPEQWSWAQRTSASSRGVMWALRATCCRWCGSQRCETNSLRSPLKVDSRGGRRSTPPPSDYRKPSRPDTSMASDYRLVVCWTRGTKNQTQSLVQKVHL